jgi:hypothetical protein
LQEAENKHRLLRTKNARLDAGVVSLRRMREEGRVCFR